MICPGRRFDYWRSGEKKYLKSGTSNMIAYFGRDVGRFVDACRRYEIGQPYLKV